MMHLTMWYAGYSSYESWAAALHHGGSSADEIVELHGQHLDAELRAIRCNSTPHARSRRDGTRA